MANLPRRVSNIAGREHPRLCSDSQRARPRWSNPSLTASRLTGGSSTGPLAHESPRLVSRTYCLISRPVVCEGYDDGPAVPGTACQEAFAIERQGLAHKGLLRFPELVQFCPFPRSHRVTMASTRCQIHIKQLRCALAVFCQHKRFDRGGISKLEHPNQGASPLLSPTIHRTGALVAYPKQPSLSAFSSQTPTRLAMSALGRKRTFGWTARAAAGGRSRTVRVGTREVESRPFAVETLCFGNVSVGDATTQTVPLRGLRGIIRCLGC